MAHLTLDELLTACRACTACRLSETRTQVVPGDGDPEARLMVVGEGPGEDEDRSGHPFVGRAGQLLNQILEAAGIPRPSVYVTNMVKCRPPGNRNPQGDEVEACDHWLLDQIRLVRPQLIVTLGNVPTQYFLETKVGITRTRGRWGEFRRLGAPIPVMPLFHPAYLLRNPVRSKGGPKSLTWDDIREVKRRLDALPARPAAGVNPEEGRLF